MKTLCRICNEQPATSPDYDGVCRWESCEQAAEREERRHLFDGTCHERGACAEFAPKPAPTLACGCCSVGCAHERCATEHKQHLTTTAARGSAAGVVWAQHRESCEACTPELHCEAGAVLYRALVTRVRA